MARLGGEEFAVLLPDMAPGRSEALARLLLQAMVDERIPLERIKALPKDKALRVEALVTTLEQEAPLTQLPQQVLDEITAFRESLCAVHGTFPDSAVVIRELRENGF